MNDVLGVLLLTDHDNKQQVLMVGKEYMVLLLFSFYFFVYSCWPQSIDSIIEG